MRSGYSVWIGLSPWAILLIFISRVQAHVLHQRVPSVQIPVGKGGEHADLHHPLHGYIEQDGILSELGWDQFMDFRPPDYNIRTARTNPKTPEIDPEVEYNRTLLPLVFEPLPLGSIKPLGWQLQQMQLMADGLPGHMHEFYRLVKDAPWMGGDKEYSPLNEAYSYYFDGIVPLAYGLNDERLKEHVLRSAEYLFAHQQDDGWFGPEKDLRRRNFWGRYPLFLGFIQLAEAEPRLTSTIVMAMHRFIDLMHKMLSNGYQGYVWKPGDLFDEQWGRSRAADMIITLQWLYEKHPRQNADKLHDCMVFMYEMAYDWSYWFTEDVFIKEDLDMFPVEITRSLFPYVHGVNAGQGLKAGAVMRRITHTDDLLQSTRDGVNWTFEYHGTPSGAIIGDERESGLSPVRGTELCSVIETMYSLNYLYQALGDRDFADRSELAAFNAMPTMILPHWWAHQYIAQTNQPVSHRIDRPPFWNVGPFGQTFGTEPNYPCCAVRFSTGLPKWISQAFVKHGDSHLVHALLGPAEVNTTLAHNNRIHIQCKTNYPFSHVLTYSITSDKPFIFSVRVPSWADIDSPARDLTINSAPPQRLQTTSDTGLHTITLPAGQNTLHIKFDTQLRILPRTNNTVSIYHGALLYALPIPGTYASSRPARYPGFEAPKEAQDWTITPSPESTWNLAIDPSTARFFAYPNRDDENGLPNPIWTDDAPPVSVSVLACEIDWRLTEIDGGYAPEPPPKGSEGRKCRGPAFMVELRPYGSAKLHVAELPVVDLSPGSRDLWDPWKDGNGGKDGEL